MLIAPGETHVATHVPLVSCQIIKIEPVVVERELSDEGRGLLRQFSGGQVERPDIAKYFSSLCQAVESPERDAFERRALLRVFLFAAFSSDGNQQHEIARVHSERAIMRVCEILRYRYDESLTLEYLEKETGISKYHLERSFHSRMGLPIHRYLKLVRLAKAQELLRRGLPAIAVAQKTGFYDSAHMSRAFAGEFGVAPGAYARASKS